jgi:hypothetical protein
VPGLPENEHACLTWSAHPPRQATTGPFGKRPGFISSNGRHEVTENGHCVDLSTYGIVSDAAIGGSGINIVVALLDASRAFLAQFAPVDVRVFFTR